MMPKLPPHEPSSCKAIEAWADARALAYGKAVAEACARICMNIVDCDDPAQCAAAIREAAKELGK